MRFLRHTLSPATVMSAIALFVSLGGASYAIVLPQIRSSAQIANGAVKGADLAKNSVTSDKIGQGQVKAADIAGNQVTADKIATGAVKATDLGKEQITSEKIAKQTVQGDNIAPDTVTGANVVESTLDQVERAARALSAGQADTAGRAQTAGNADTVGGLGVRTFHYLGNSTTGPLTILNNFGGLTLTGGCAANDLDFTALNASGESAEFVYSKTTEGQPGDSLSGALTSSGTVLGADPDNDTTGVLVFNTATNRTVTVTFALDEGARWHSAPSRAPPWAADRFLLVWWMYGRPGASAPHSCDGGHNFGAWNFASDDALPPILAALQAPPG